ncbi:MAG TPA: HigA family addiction module antitoxin [Burkholderiales bacterium]|nr:HigA family addiction module antitoxin [Burkholderiales bacterium]
MLVCDGQRQLESYHLLRRERRSGRPLRGLSLIMAVSLRMHKPPHPGEILRQLCLEPLGLTVTEAAEGLGVSRKTLSAILNGRASVSPEMAVRLSLAFGTSAESWLNHQLQYDLWQLQKQRKNLRVVKLAA